MEGGGIGRLGLDDMAFVPDDLEPACLGVALHRDLLRDRRVKPSLFTGAAGLSMSSRASHIRPLTSTQT